MRAHGSLTTGTGPTSSENSLSIMKSFSNLGGSGAAPGGCAAWGLNMPATSSVTQYWEGVGSASQFIAITKVLPVCLLC